MKEAARYDQARFAPQRRLARRAYVIGLVSALAFAAAFGLSAAAPSEDDTAGRSSPETAQTPDAYALILDALFAPTLKADAVPLRWSDPRAALRCGPHTAVRVNRLPLVSGDLVPETPFELEWHADGCRLPGEQQARIDGWVKLTVFREDWGVSAIVEPSGLRVAFAGYERAVAQRGAAWLPRCSGAAQSQHCAGDDA